MQADLKDLWCATWNSKTWSLRARKLDEELRDMNRALVNGVEHDERIVAVTETLEMARHFITVLKRILKAKTETKKGDDENDNRDQRTEGERENDGGELSATEN